MASKEQAREQVIKLLVSDVSDAFYTTSKFLIDGVIRRALEATYPSGHPMIGMLDDGQKLPLWMVTIDPRNKRILSELSRAGWHKLIR